MESEGTTGPVLAGKGYPSPGISNHPYEWVIVKFDA